MSYRIEFTPERLTVRADVESEADFVALIRALDAVSTAMGADPNRPEEITRAPKAAKALRAAKVEKEIRPEPPEPAIQEQDDRPARIARTPVRPLPDDDEADDAARLDAAMDAEDPPEEPEESPPAKRARSNSVPADRDEKLKALWATGLTTQEIADRLNMGSPSNVSFRAKYLGLPSRGRGGARAHPAPAKDGGFDAAYYARKAIIPNSAGPASGAAITAALMGDPSHGPSLGVELAGPQQRGGEAI